MKAMVQGFETSISGAGIFPSTQKKRYCIILEKKWWSGEASRLLSPFYKRWCVAGLAQKQNTPWKTKIFAPKNGGPLEKEIPIGNHHF